MDPHRCGQSESLGKENIRPHQFIGAKVMEGLNTATKKTRGRVWWHVSTSAHSTCLSWPGVQLCGACSSRPVLYPDEVVGVVGEHRLGLNLEKIHTFCKISYV